MSIFLANFDRFEVYVDLFDTFVTCVEKTQNFDQWSRKADLCVCLPSVKTPTR